MINPLTRLTIKGKMMLLIILPILALVYFTGTELKHHNYEFENKLEKIRQLVSLSESISRLVHETQKERGASAGFTGSRGKKFATRLPEQRRLTDQRLKEYKATLASIDLSIFPGELKHKIKELDTYIRRLPEIRQRVSALQLPLKKVVAFYTEMNDHMLDIVATSSKLSPAEKITIDLVAYTSFLKSKERAGIERAVLSATFGADKFAPGMFEKLITLIAE